LQHRNLVIDAVDSLVAGSIGLDDNVAPHQLDHALDWHIVRARKIDRRPIDLGILFEQGQSSNERTMGFVIRAER
jgi:hypothetical protein